MTTHPFLHPKARGRCLSRLRKMRDMGAPPEIIRHEQLFLWAIRQMRATGAAAPTSLPGWAANYQKFVRIHRPEGRA